MYMYLILLVYKYEINMKSNVSINKSMFKIHSYGYIHFKQLINIIIHFNIKRVDYQTKTYFTLRSKHMYNIQCSNYHILNLHFHISEKKN